MEFKHYSVLLKESVDALSVKSGGVYVDGTMGGGGHSFEILRRGAGKLIGIDQDHEAIFASRKRLECFGDKLVAVNSNFSGIKNILQDLGIDEIDGAVLDLGVSSYQLDNAERGFSYMHNAPLDMRMNRSSQLNAYEVINEYTESELTRIFYEYGEEKWSKRIAQFITDRRSKAKIETTGELADIVKAAIPKKARQDGGHPAKRVFQAVRIEVNGELKILQRAIEDFIDVLKPGGVLSIITFHSLEDRIVKQTFARLAQGCTCPKSFPVCVCGTKPKVKLVMRKPVLPSERELSENSRSKSAKLRAAMKL
ncbi:MAG: 16S rRNA (cytosine(1402)-N(4))-methyltransferase RsmH [Oscillospiraceae bacterium]|nr:16S rRNA (cytosine(1402)-N(4))-methyltransferase RsmH [Oscillospiraceae bacterium]